MVRRRVLAWKACSTVNSVLLQGEFRKKVCRDFQYCFRIQCFVVDRMGMGILVYPSNIQGDAKAYVIIPIVVNSKQYCDFQVMFTTEIQPKSKDFAQNQNSWFFNDSSKIVKYFSQNLGQLGPENCRAYVFFACFLFVCFVFVFPSFFFLSIFPLSLSPPFFPLFFFTHRLILICTYIPHCTISVSKI